MEATLTLEKTAELLGVATQTLRNWRTQGRGPAGFKVGDRRVMYRREVVEAWLAEQEAGTSSNSSRPTH